MRISCETSNILFARGHDFSQPSPTGDPNLDIQLNRYEVETSRRSEYATPPPTPSALAQPRSEASNILYVRAHDFSTSSRNNHMWDPTLDIALDRYAAEASRVETSARTQENTSTTLQPATYDDGFHKNWSEEDKLFC